ncbi:MAG: ribonuclease III [Candidatus Moraniibacteriota bacterium]|nr:MAG: ribonuclease III [Candidatus Moranbacteria bacterium]
MQPFDASSVSRILGVPFSNADFFQTALTHRSYLNEHRGYTLDHNERLEFLGDAVLELVVTEYLYHHFPNPEGELTSWRAALVNGEMLSRVGGDLGIEPFLLMSRGEAKDTGRSRQYLIANAMEAIIGALYLDQGYEAAKNFILRVIVSRLPHVFDQKLYADPKSLFQEQAQTRLGITPSYRVLFESGPDHDKQFTAGAYLGEELIAEGMGNSKQEAQRFAAKNALEKKGW